jgi:hypothetical protein
VKSHLLLALTLLSLLSGCVTTHNNQYNWGKYDPSLYGYYKDPTKLGELNASLSAIVNAAETNKAAVPPGIYAEYGYLQLQQGNNAQAIALFKQEEALWPEAKVFMDHMIKVASPPATPAGPGSP